MCKFQKLAFYLCFSAAWGPFGVISRISLVKHVGFEEFRSNFGKFPIPMPKVLRQPRNIKGSPIIPIINNIKSPLMVIHGEKDNIISIEFGKKVFDAAPEPKEALFVPNASHNNLFEFNVDEKILGFLEKRRIYGFKYQ